MPGSRTKAPSFLLATLLLGGCSLKPVPRDPMATPTSSPSAPPADPSKVVAFSFTDLDGKGVSTATVSGRTTVIFFATSYDSAALAETHFMVEIAHRHSPRINVVLVDLERDENRPLVQAFQEALHRPFPFCMADAETLAGQGPFPGMNAVPSIVILDKGGHEKYRHLGLQQQDEIEAAITSVQ